MRKILTLLIAATALLVASQTQARVDGLFTIRSEITNQMVINSNSVPFNKSLATALRKALTAVDRPGNTNIANNLKALSVVTTSLRKTAIYSNILSHQIESELNDYIATIADNVGNSSNRLAATLPSGTRNSAQKNLNLIYNYLHNADTFADLAKAISELGKAVSKLAVTENLIVKAEAVRPGPNSLTAKISAGGEGTFTYKPIPVSVQASYSPVTKILNVTSTYIKPGLTTLSRSVGFVLGNLEPGTHTYNVSSLSICYYNTSTVKVGVGLLSGDVYEDNSGSITVTLNPNQRVVSGTFNFSGNGSNHPNNTASVEGSFTINYLQ